MATFDARGPGGGVGVKDRTKPDYKYVGKSVRRIDGVAKVTGASQFSTDFYPKGMLHAKILFSDRPYARIIDIDVSEALTLPGVKAVITGDDSPDRRYGPYLKDKTVLAKGEVRFIGDRVAAVAAINERIAERAVRLIRVTYDDLDPLLDTKAALEEGASRLHPDVTEYEAGFPYIRYGNVCMEAELARGDVAKAFAESDVVLKGVYRTGAVNQAPIEPHACVAGFDHRGRLTVWTATQQLSVCHAELAAALEIPMGDVRVIPLECGGGFGGKLKTNLEPLTALLALRTGQSVRLAMTREEEFVAANSRAPFQIEIKLGATSDGKFTGGEVDIVADAGAYADHVIGTASHALSSSEGVYRHGRCEREPSTRTIPTTDACVDTAPSRRFLHWRLTWMRWLGSCKSIQRNSASPTWSKTGMSLFQGRRFTMCTYEKQWRQLSLALGIGTRRAQWVRTEESASRM